MLHSSLRKSSTSFTVHSMRSTAAWQVDEQIGARALVYGGALIETTGVRASRRAGMDTRVETRGQNDALGLGTRMIMHGAVTHTRRNEGAPCPARGGYYKGKAAGVEE